METYAYIGNEDVGVAIGGSLASAGFSRVDDVVRADAVITFCTAQDELEDVYFETDGLIKQVRPGTLLIDLSPSTPSFARELEAVAIVSDLAFVEAPIAVADPTRPDAFADPANVAVCLAGEEDAVAAAMPFAEAIADDVHLLGGSGSAQVAKASFTVQYVAQIVSAIEAQALRDAVRTAPAGTGANVSGPASPQSAVAEHVLAAAIAERFSGAYTVEILMADLAAALATADDVDLILPQAESCMHLFELLAVIGGSDLSAAALSLVYGEEAACARHGLDWTRAEEAFGDHAHDHGGDADYDDDDDFDDEYPPTGFGYSAN